MDRTASGVSLGMLPLLLLLLVVVVTGSAIQQVPPTTPRQPYTVVVPQPDSSAEGAPSSDVVLTFHAPTLITGAINTTLYDATTRNATPAGNGEVQLLNSTAAFTSVFFALDERHVFGQLLWYGGKFTAADGINRDYSMYQSAAHSASPPRLSTTFTHRSSV